MYRIISDKEQEQFAAQLKAWLVEPVEVRFEIKSYAWGEEFTMFSLYLGSALRYRNIASLFVDNPNYFGWLVGEFLPASGLKTSKPVEEKPPTDWIGQPWPERHPDGFRPTPGTSPREGQVEVEDGAVYVCHKSRAALLGIEHFWWQKINVPF